VQANERPEEERLYLRSKTHAARANYGTEEKEEEEEEEEKP